MRPLSLTIQAFGAFLGRQTLDFGALGDHRLFLIGGPTGAGKTTLLDAICFALYGDSSGNERVAEQMRSDHADPMTRTEVLLDFAIGPAGYRIHRIPRQERARRRGGGTTVEKQDATLWGSGQGDADGPVLATGWGNVTAEVERLVGFRSAQFRQVIVLPQGRFRELLAAGAGEREQILKTLFHTEVYTRIQDALKSRAAAIEQATQALEIRRRTLLDQAGAETPGQLAQRLTDQAASLLESRSRVHVCQAAEQAALTGLQAGRDARDRLAARDGAAATLAALDGRRPQIDLHRESLAAAQRALGLADLRARLAAERETLARIESASAGARIALDLATGGRDAALVRLGSEESRGSERLALGLEIHRLTQLAGRVQRLAEARIAHEQAARLSGESTQAAESAAARAADCQAERSRALELRESLAPVAARAEVLAAQVADLTRRVLERRALDSAIAETRQAERARLQGIAALDLAEQGLVQARSDQESLHRRWTQGQAQVLAGTLGPGAPCPVCGSTRHPAPATGAAQVPSEPDLEHAKGRVADAESTRDQAREALAGATSLLAAARARTQGLESALAGYLGLGLDAIAAQLDAHRAELAAARAAGEALAGVAAALPRLDALAESAELGLSSAETARAERDRQLAAAQGALAERESEVPESWRTPGALAQAIAERTGVLAAADEALRSAREQARASDLAHATAQAGLQAQIEQLESARARFVQTQAQWSERRTQAGFPDDPAFLGASLDEPARAGLERAVADYDLALQAARTMLGHAAAEAHGLATPDLPALEAAARQARESRETDERALAAAVASQSQLARLQDALARVAADLAERESDYAVMGRLAEVANGKNPHRLSFQRFVLTALLDDVLIAASQRLQSMSRGRYRLERGRGPTDLRQAGGLDLLVDDGYTGKLRGVATLSGGEGFQAALSLALGLAEVVQAYAGGVHMDTVFIDEGFGSLDPEALDLAIDTLVDLQQGGRLVGVVSHVPELKERIDVRLEVNPGRGGSHARFVLP
jgi:DNA repair protein SbcC/Rad50